MIAASIKDGEDLVHLLLQKGADANLKSTYACWISRLACVLAVVADAPFAIHRP